MTPADERAGMRSILPCLLETAAGMPTAASATHAPHAQHKRQRGSDDARSSSSFVNSHCSPCSRCCSPLLVSCDGLPDCLDEADSPVPLASAAEATADHIYALAVRNFDLVDRALSYPTECQTPCISWDNVFANCQANAQTCSQICTVRCGVAARALRLAFTSPR